MYSFNDITWIYHIGSLTDYCSLLLQKRICAKNIFVSAQNKNSRISDVRHRKVVSTVRYAGQMVSDDLGTSWPLPFAWNSEATRASRFHASR